MVQLCGLVDFVTPGFVTIDSVTFNGRAVDVVAAKPAEVAVVVTAVVAVVAVVVVLGFFQVFRFHFALDLGTGDLMTGLTPIFSFFMFTVCSIAPRHALLICIISNAP